MGGELSSISMLNSRPRKSVDQIKVVVRHEDCALEQGKARDKTHEIDMELMRLMLPVWYTTADLSKEDVSLAKSVWGHILNDTSREFLRLKGSTGFPYKSAVVWFFDMFYSRFFDMYPSVKPLFKSGLLTQGRFLVKMISMLLGALDNEQEFEESLYKLVVSHNARGIKAFEYGIVGEVLFHTLRRCTGPAYTVDVNMAWMRVFSRMLTSIVPKALAMEMETSSAAQIQRFVELEEAENAAPPSPSATVSRTIHKLEYLSKLTAESRMQEADEKCPFK